MKKLNDMQALAVILEYIPIEMYWAYEAVRQSGLYNMNCLHPLMRKDLKNTTAKEFLNVMNRVYIKFCIYNKADVEGKQYKYITKDHITIIQQVYTYLQEYYDPMLNNIVNIKKEIKEHISL